MNENIRRQYDDLLVSYKSEYQQYLCDDLLDGNLRSDYSKKGSAYTLPKTPKEIIKILEANGFVYVRSTGSHRRYRNPQNGRLVSVPYHTKSLKLGTERSILKQAGLL